MGVILQSLRGGLPRRSFAWISVLCGMLAWAFPAHAQPMIETQPAGVTVYETQSATLNVVASGAGPIGYQWRMMGTNLPGATLPSLVLTNVTAATTGLFDVVATNASGAITSAPVLVVVLARPIPALSFGAYAPGPVPSVPVAFMAYGGETNLGFSVAYNPLGLASPRFMPALTNLAGTIEVNATSHGLLGVQVTLTNGASFPPGPGTLGTVVFDVVPGSPRYAAGLALTNGPVALSCGPIGGTNFVPVALPPDPVVRLLDASDQPVLDGQTGLFLHRLEIGNPGITTNATVELRVSGFTHDGRESYPCL